MGLTRSSSGLKVRDDFGSDTTANYDPYNGALSVGSGRLSSNANDTWAVHKTSSGTNCVTGAYYVNGASAGGVLLCANGLIDAVADIDGYLSRRIGDSSPYSKLIRMTNAGVTELATDATNLTVNATNVVRCYRSGTTIYLKTGVTAFTVALSATDDTYTGDLYAAAYLKATAHPPDR